MRIFSLALVALAVTGCHYALNDKGTDPETDQLYFPAGIAMDPGGRFVYVSNGNADLRYGGGTVTMVDMLAFECTVARFRQTVGLDAAAALPDACKSYAPPDSSDDAYWDAWASAKRGACVRDPIDPSIVDCDESGFILQNSTVKIGNFAGTIRLVADPNDPLHRKLFVAVRGDPSITTIDVELPGAQGAVAQSLSDPGLLVCTTNPQALKQRPQYNAATQTTSAPPGCDASYLIQDFNCEGLPSCLPGTDQNDKTQLPTEPFNMQVDAIGAPMVDQAGNVVGHSPRLLVSHLASGQVSVINVEAGAANALLSESTPFFTPDASGRHGAFALAQQYPNDPHSQWYLTSNVSASISTFRVGDSNIVIPLSQLSLSATFAQGSDVRDIRFDVGGSRAFITDNNPPSVVVMDTRPVSNNGDANLNQVVDVINVCQEPSHLGVRRFVEQGATGTPATVKTKLVVVCFVGSQAMIVDPDRPGVDDTIFSGLVGPNDIAFNFSNADDPTPITQLVPRHGYITNYSESTVAVVDLEPHSPTENHVIARLGFPAGSDAINP